ncbi:MAG: hypothetical protein AB7F35_15490 [Acetobacteraceae bacterium]
MMYHHTPQYQVLLQKALREKARGRSDERIATDGGLGCSKMTVQRFRTAKNLESRQRLMLHYDVAVKLWNFCRRELEDIIRRREAGDDFYKHAERLAADAMMAFYYAHPDQTRRWAHQDGLQTEYLCYKPSFRRPGQVVKSRFTIDIVNDQYFKVVEDQADGGKPGIQKSTEHSEGFGFSKSGRLWFFLMEQSREQPRVFCFHKRDIDADGSITRLIGYVMESDKRYSGGVFTFKVGLTSRDWDVKLWEQFCPGELYQPDNQIDNVPIPKVDLITQMDDRRVIFDADTLKYIKPDVLKGVDAQSLD